MNFDLAETFDGTWLVEVPKAVISFLGPLLPVAVVGAVIAIIAFAMLRFIAKGGGQYGIIEGYVGTIGAGKTTLAVQHSLNLAKARDAVLLSNIPVICNPSKGREGKRGYKPGCKGRRQYVGERPTGCVIDHALLPMGDNGVDLGVLTTTAFELRDQGRGLVLLMDEVGVIMPARLWKDFSVALMWVLQQSRKLACEWIWTAQDPTFVDHQLRSLTSVVHYVRSYPPPSVWRRVRGKRPWLLIASAFTPTNAPRANGETSGRAAEKRMGRSWRRYKRAWELSFDTDGVVLPSRHLKGAEVLHDAAGLRTDVHVIEAELSDWGPLEQATPEPVAGRP